MKGGTKTPHILPQGIKGCEECIEYLIKTLQRKVEFENLDEDEIEDALDDGFLCIDVNVLSQKLKNWQIMFPEVTPYMAMKCK